MTGGMGGGGGHESRAYGGKALGMADVNGQSPRFLAEPRNDGGYGAWGGHESRAYGGKALGMADVNGQVLDSSRSLGMTGGMGRGGPRESCVRGEGSGHGGCEWASPRFLAEPRNDRGYGAWGGHGGGAHGERASRSYGGRWGARALGMADVNGQVLDSSRSLGMTGGMGGGGATRVVRMGGGLWAWRM